MKYKSFAMEWAGRKLEVEVGKLAQQANGSCTVRYGDTVVLASATMAETAREGIDFFPLMVDYEEKLYAAGKIKGSRFIKREGRPSDEAVLTGRMIDRGLRPLFNQKMRNDVQIIVSVLSYDNENDPDIPSIIAASIALHISDIPWNGPLAATRVGYIDEQFVLNPLYGQREKSLLDLAISNSKDKVLMIESGAKEVNEDIYLGAFAFGLKQTESLFDFIEDIRNQVGKQKREIAEPAVILEDGAEFTQKEQEELTTMLKDYLKTRWPKFLFNIPVGSKGERKKILKQLKEQVVEFFTQKDISAGRLKILLDNFDALAEEEVTAAILQRDERIDGRGLQDIRTLQMEVGLLPRTHGSGLFMRGETQVLSVVTLGAPGDEQSLDGLEEVGKKRYMHHYNFPPYSVGEVGMLRGAGRREIGHGALAEKALIPVLPDKETFPYTIRVVSEVLGSNGSSSMASTCGSSLALMDAGVPIKNAVVGIAIGLASDKEGNYKLITDIQDLEDGDGGMDFKVCGTANGITAIQMDTKTLGLNLDIIKDALAYAREAHAKILQGITAVLPKPREQLSPYAPRIVSFMINPDKIREVIGPGGKMINEIIAATGVTIDIEDSGQVMITSSNLANLDKARKWIEDIVREAKVGEIYEGKVVKITDFGAFLEILPKQDGLLHISEIDSKRIRKVEDVLKTGDKMKVQVIGIDPVSGKINLSRKRLLKTDNKN